MRPTAWPPLPGPIQRHRHHATPRRTRPETTQPSPSHTVLVAASCRLLNGIISRSPRPFLTTTCRQQGPFARRALPRVLTHTDPAATRSSFPRLPGRPVYTTDPTPRAFSLGRDGLLQLLSMSCVPVLPVPPRRCDLTRQPDCVSPYSLRPRSSGSATGSLRFSRQPLRSLALRPGDSLAILTMTLSIGFSSLGFPPGCYPSYGASGSSPGGSHSH